MQEQGRGVVEDAAARSAERHYISASFTPDVHLRFARLAARLDTDPGRLVAALAEAGANLAGVVDGTVESVLGEGGARLVEALRAEGFGCAAVVELTPAGRRAIVAGSPEVAVARCQAMMSWGRFPGDRGTCGAAADFDCETHGPRCGPHACACDGELVDDAAGGVR